MKVYHRKDFMQLPEGTIYSKGKPWYFEGISVKGETLLGEDGPCDWICLGLEWIEARNEDEQWFRLDKMLTEGVSYSMNESYGRDGCFDNDDIFLVFEKEDLLKVKEFVEKAVEVKHYGN